MCCLWNIAIHVPVRDYQESVARRGGAVVAGWTLDRKIRVRFPAYPHRVWAPWWQGGKRRIRTSRYLCRGRLGTLKTPSCPWRGCPAADQNLETGHLSRHYIAEISLTVMLNHNQQSTTTSRKCDNRIDRHKDRRRIKLSLYAAMLRRRHKTSKIFWNKPNKNHPPPQKK